MLISDPLISVLWGVVLCQSVTRVLNILEVYLRHVSFSKWDTWEFCKCFSRRQLGFCSWRPVASHPRGFCTSEEDIFGSEEASWWRWLRTFTTETFASLLAFTDLTGYDLGLQLSCALFLAIWLLMLSIVNSKQMCMQNNVICRTTMLWRISSADPERVLTVQHCDWVISYLDWDTDRRTTSLPEK